MRFYRYSRWDGTQEIDPFTASELMEHIADRVLEGGDLWSAMRDMLQRGARLPSGRQMPGLRDLLDRLRQRREQQLQRYNMDSVMDDIRQKLEEIVQAERNAIERRLEANYPWSQSPAEQGERQRGEPQHSEGQQGEGQ